jgi:hypothetical protein
MQGMPSNTHATHVSQAARETVCEPVPTQVGGFRSSLKLGPASFLEPQHDHQNIRSASSILIRGALPPPLSPA